MIKQRQGICVYLLLAFFSLTLFPGGPALAAEPPGGSPAFSQFSDVSGTDINGVYINYLTSKGILGGFPDGNFHPDQGLTRAQAAAAICRAVNLNPGSGKDTGFKDIGQNHWAAGYIAAAVKAGYLAGFPDGTFKPETELSRCQGISLVLKLSQQADPGTALPQLADMDNSHWAARSMAIALDAGMIQARTGNRIQPDSPMSRGDLSRALALLLTQDPQLASRKLYSTMTVNSGEVKLSRKGASTAKSITGNVQVGAGDTIETGSNAEAVINYPDGSSLLLKSNSTLVIKESLGRAYIKKDGKPGTAIDNLEVELKTGKLFGGLSSLAQPAVQDPESDAAATSMNNPGSKLPASAADKGVPWYKTAQQKKVKVKVVMAWGETAVRGTFWNDYANSNGSGVTSILVGSAAVTAGGQTVSLSPGQATGGSAGGAPSAAAPMTAQQLGEWSQVSQWVQNTGAAIINNQAAGLLGPASPGEVSGNPADSLTQTLNQALSQAEQAAGSIPGSPSSSSSSSSPPPASGTITVSGIPKTVLLPQYVPNPLGGSPLPGTGTFSFTVNLVGAHIGAGSSSGDDVVDLAISGAGTASRCATLYTKGGTGTEHISLIIDGGPNCNSLATIFDVTVLRALSTTPAYKMAGYSTPVMMNLYDSTGKLWAAGASGMTVQVIDLNTCQSAACGGAACAPIAVAPGSITANNIDFALNYGLACGSYGLAVYDGTSPIAMGYLKVSSAPATLTSSEPAPVDAPYIDMPLTCVDPDWLSAALASPPTVTIDGTLLTSGGALVEYPTSSGQYVLRLTPDGFSPVSPLESTGAKTVAIGNVGAYPPINAAQTLIPGTADADHSKYDCSPALAPGSTVTVNITLRDKHNNICSSGAGSANKIFARVTVTNNDPATSEQYNTGAAPGTLTGSPNPDIYMVTCSGGLSSFTITMPGTIDYGDGISIVLFADTNNDNIGDVSIGALTNTLQYTQP